MRNSFLRPVGSILLVAVPATKAFFPTSRTSCTPLTVSTTAARMTSSTAVSSLPPLLDASDGKPLSEQQRAELLTSKRVAYYFAAGWCGMCTSFEPSLTEFLQTAKDSGKEVELIYVPSDRSPENALQRGKALGMACVPYGEDADKIKKEFRVWAGSESGKLGTDRRSGVPAIVVLDSKGDEMAFLAAESQGPAALKSWPLDEETGVW